LHVVQLNVQVMTLTAGVVEVELFDDL
jgi:hypothetical protein